MREPGLFSLEKGRHKCLMGGRKDEGASTLASEGTKGNEQKLQYRTFCEGAAKSFSCE